MRKGKGKEMFLAKLSIDLGETKWLNKSFMKNKIPNLIKLIILLRQNMKKRVGTLN